MVPLTGTIHYEGRNIGVVLNKNTDTETDEKFKNRLHWDNQTGLFTLSDLRTEDSGGYTVESSKDRFLFISFLHFFPENVPAPQVTSSSNSSSDNTVCSLLCSVINGRGLVLFWYKDNFILNRTSSSNLNAILHLPLEIEKPKNDNFICVVSNPVSNKTTTANITTLCYHSPEVYSQCSAQWGFCCGSNRGCCVSQEEKMAKGIQSAHRRQVFVWICSLDS
uniref:Ig-like domain-containing protein n=1 Tax=Electrophorus electricus TaxID=8005 RepID=A0A4W4EEQ2_ELEEL